MKPLFLPKVENPFSEKFVKTWQLWKDFRQQFDNFWYKTDISQQLALNKLVTLSDGDEEKAILIVEQSMEREWSGFYPLKSTRKKDLDGKSKQPAPKSTGQQPASNTEKFKRNFMQGNGSGEQEGDGTHLKAV